MFPENLSIGKGTLNGSRGIGMVVCGGPKKKSVLAPNSLSSENLSYRNKRGEDRQGGRENCCCQGQKAQYPIWAWEDNGQQHRKEVNIG